MRKARDRCDLRSACGGQERRSSLLRQGAASTPAIAHPSRTFAVAARAVERARELGRAAFAVAARRRADVDPLAFAAGEEVAILARSDLEIAAAGAAARIVAAGEGRFARVAAEARALFDAVVADPDVSRIAAPRLVGGFAFADADPHREGFPAARLVLPARLAVRAAAGETWLVAAERVEPEDDALAVAARLEEALGAAPDAGLLDAPIPLVRAIADGREEVLRWRARVAEARAEIAAATIEKVVIARTARARAASAIPPVALAARLRAAEPRALAFIFAAPGGNAFFGATPERLVRRAGRSVTTAALAGTAPLAAAAGRLLSSAKDRAEHALVVRAILDALAPIARLSPPRAPRVVRFAHVQHLSTPIEAELREDASILDLVARLYPTPAVGGAPRGAALAFIRAREALDRGWYAGAIGWLDAAGDGDFAVAIRSAHLAGHALTRFAGAGIVAASDPEAEWSETEAKLRALAGPLGTE